MSRLEGTLAGELEPPDYRGTARELGMTEGAVKVAAHRLRKRYREALRREIADTVTTPEEVEDELGEQEDAVRDSYDEQLQSIRESTAQALEAVESNYEGMREAAIQASERANEAQQQYWLDRLDVETEGWEKVFEEYEDRRLADVFLTTNYIVSETVTLLKARGHSDP